MTDSLPSVVSSGAASVVTRVGSSRVGGENPLFLVGHLHGPRLAHHDRGPYPLIRIHGCDVFRLGHRVTARQDAGHECQQNDVSHRSLLRLTTLVCVYAHSEDNTLSGTNIPRARAARDTSAAKWRQSSHFYLHVIPFKSVRWRGPTRIQTPGAGSG